MGIDLSTPQTLGHVVQCLQKEGISTRQALVPEPEGLCVLTPDISPPPPGQFLTPTWEVRTTDNTPIALSKAALRKIEATCQLHPELAVWGSAHLMLVVKFIDQKEPVVLTLWRDDKPPTWKNCLGTLGGYPSALAWWSQPDVTAAIEGSEEVVITIPDGQGGRVALTWDTGTGENHSHESRERVGLGNIPVRQIRLEPFRAMDHLIRYLHNGIERHTTRGTPIYDEVNRRYDTVIAYSLDLSCRMEEAVPMLAEVTPSGELVRRPLGWLDPLRGDHGQMVTAWEDGHSADHLLGRDLEVTPTLRGFIERYRRARMLNQWAET